MLFIQVRFYLIMGVVEDPLTDTAGLVLLLVASGF